LAEVDGDILFAAKFRPANALNPSQANSPHCLFLPLSASRCIYPGSA